MSKSSGPLDGLRVIEFAHVMAGPVAGLMLADLGADVIKVEKVPGGDDARRQVPPSIGEEAAAFMMVNRNKRGIALDLKTDGGREAARRLVGASDVVIENYRLGTMERLGLGYDALRRDNPGLIYCEISGFGRTGPYADRGGFDLIAQAMSGLMRITGEGPEGPPVKVGAPVTDITAGILGAMGVLAATIERQRTGRGQRVDTSLFEAGIAQGYWQSAIFLATGQAPGALGTAHPLNAPYQAFETADGWIAVGAANQANWLRLVDALGAAALARDPRFSDNAARMANIEALTRELTGHFRGRTNADWLARLDAAGVPAGPVNTIADLHADRQAIAREMFPTVDHANLGPVKTIGLPVKFSQSPGGVHRAAPVYGQHTREVLAEIGYGEAEVDALLDSGAAVAG